VSDASAVRRIPIALHLEGANRWHAARKQCRSRAGDALRGPRTSLDVVWQDASYPNRGSAMPNVTASNEVALLRAELELLMTERENLLRTVGAASVFIANLDAETLPEAAWDAGDILAECLNDLPEDTLHDALELVRPLMVKDLENAKD